MKSFGSLAVALFWSFVASSNDTISAKKGYALIICGAQFGSVAGPLLARMASVIGIPILLLFVVCGIMTVPFLVSYFVKSYPKLMPELSMISSKLMNLLGRWKDCVCFFQNHICLEFLA